MHPIEKLRLEFDAYAKLENTITFILTDLAAFQDYLKSNRPPLPKSLMQEFVKNLKEFKEDAEFLKKTYESSSGSETAVQILNEIDTHSHRSLGDMMMAREFSRLARALEAWNQTDLFKTWQKALSDLGTSTLKKMNSLLKEIDKVA
jgi:hypothetical protein